MTDSWTEERAGFIKDIVPGILQEYPGLDETQLVAVLEMVVSGLDEMWRQTLRELADHMVRNAGDSVTRPGVLRAAKALKAFVEAP